MVNRGLWIAFVPEFFRTNQSPLPQSHCAAPVVDPGQGGVCSISLFFSG